MNSNEYTFLWTIFTPITGGPSESTELTGTSMLMCFLKVMYLLAGWFEEISFSVIPDGPASATDCFCK